MLKLLHPLGAGLGAEKIQAGLLAVSAGHPLIDHPGMGHRGADLGPGLQIAAQAGVFRPLLQQVPLLPAGQGHDGLK